MKPKKINHHMPVAFFERSPGSLLALRNVVVALTSVFTAHSAVAATVTLTGTSYTQNFDSVGTALPIGFDVRTAATASSLGTIATFATTADTWASSTGGFKNVASSDGLTSAATTVAQSVSTDRAIGFRQSGSFGDPGAAIDFNFNATSASFIGSGTAFSLSLQMLSVQTRSTSLLIQYGIGSSPSSFTTLATYTDPSVFGSTALNFTGDQLAALSGVANAWIRVVATTTSTGSGSRDTIALDDFSLTYAALSGGGGGGGSGYYWVGGDSTRGGAGTWTATGGTAWATTDADAPGGAWDSTKTANFGGAVTPSAVTVGTVSAAAGLAFTSDAYTLSSGTLTLSGATSAINSISTTTGTTVIGSNLAGTSGMTKSGAGKLTLSGNNTGLSGGVSLTAGTLTLASANALGSNALSLNGGTLSSSDSTTYTVSNSIVFGGDAGFGEDSTGNLKLNGSIDLGAATRTLTVGNGVTLDVAGVTSKGGINKSGAGALTLSASNTLTTLGISAGTAVIDTGKTLTLTTSQLSSSGGALTINGTLLSTATSAWTAPAGTVTISSGGTVIQQGSGSATNFLFSANTTFSTGSTFVFRDFTSTPAVSGRTYSANLTFDSSSLPISVGSVSGSGTWTVNGDLTVGANTTVNFAAANTLTTSFNGNVIVNGTLGGTDGARSISIGTGKSLTVNTGGSLLMQSTQTLSIASGGTLAGNGAITGAITVAGNLAPGTSGAGTLTVTGTGTTFSDGSLFSWDLSGDGASYDKLITSALADGGSEGGSVFKIIAADATFGNEFWNSSKAFADIVGTPTGSTLASIFTTITVVKSNGDAFTPSKGTFSFTGNTLNFTAVPEPSSILAGLLLGAGLLRRNRSQRA